MLEEKYLLETIGYEMLANELHNKYAHFFVAKNNDDGEPAGSAGAPIFEAIKKAHLTNTLVAVVRYLPSSIPQLYKDAVIFHNEAYPANNTAYQSCNWLLA